MSFIKHDELYKQTMEAMNNGAYVTIIHYCYHNNQVKISGQTFHHGNLHTKHNVIFF